MKTSYLRRILGGGLVAVAAVAIMAGGAIAKTTLTVYTALEAEKL